jgi:hypothetical protein
MESFFTDNDSFIVVPQPPCIKPSQIIDEHQKNHNSSSDDDENNIIAVAKRKPSYTKNSLKSFKKRVATIPSEPNTVLTAKKGWWRCCF